MQYKLMLGGGTGGTAGQAVYTAPNGVIVRSSSPTYTNSTYYYMGYMFNGNNSSSDAAQYWLTTGSPATLTFDFGSIMDNMNAVQKLNVYPRCRDDSISSYSIDVSVDGTTWTNAVPLVSNTYANCPYGTLREHEIGGKFRYVRFNLSRSGAWGVSLHEVEVIADMVAGYSDVSVGAYYPVTESGWKRYEETHPTFDYTPAGGWTTASDSSHSGGAVRGSVTAVAGNRLRFDFVGDKLRLIISKATSYSDRVAVKIDGETEYFSAKDTAYIHQRLVYQKQGLSYGRHQVDIYVANKPTNSSGYDFRFDAAEINADGRMMHPDEVEFYGLLREGSRIRCHYRGNTGQMGVFSNLGEEVSDFLPAVPTALPDGDLYLIAVKEFSDRVLTMADRNVHGGLTSRILAETGIMEGLGQGERLVPLVPTLTSLTSSREVKITASKELGATWAAWRAFDGRSGADQNVRWVTGVDTSAHLTVEFLNEKKALRYSALSSTYNAAAPKDWEIQGSSNGTDWEVLDTQVGVTGLTATKMFNISNPKAYKFIRMHVTANNGYSGYFLSIDELQFYGADEFPMESMRLPSGGVAATDKDNDWDKYVVLSDLGGKRMAGDYSMWNITATWSQTYSILTGNSNNVVRGNSVPAGFSNIGPNDTALSSTGLRPMFTFMLGQQADTTLVTTISVPDREDFPSTADVYSDNGLDFTQKRSFFQVPYREDLASVLFVAPNGRVQISADIIPVFKEDIASNVGVKQPTTAVSYITVAPVSRMQVTADIVPPPTITADLIPVKDAFIREGVPRLNYGREQEMLAGSMAGGEVFKSLVQFDISSIPQNQKLKTAKLRLYVDQDRLEGEPILAYEVLKDWTEDGVTWASSPEVGDGLLTIHTNGDKAYVEVDVMPLVMDWYTGVRVNRGLMFTLDKLGEGIYARLGTKERGADYAPRLVIEYIDPQVRSYGVGEIYSTITARRTESKGVATTLTVKSTWAGDDKPSDLRVFNQDMRETSIKVSREYAVTTITVRREDTSPVATTLTVQRNDVDDKPTTIKVSREYLHTGITVRAEGKSEAVTTITVRRSDASTTDTGIKISRDYVPTQIDVWEKNQIASTITVTGMGGNGLGSDVTVRRSDAFNLRSTIDVWEKSTQASTITVKSGYFRSSIVVPYRASSDLVTKIRVAEKYASDLVTTIHIGGYDDLYTTIIVEIDEGGYAFIM